ncbi:sensor histidine kinase [Dawidia soli]|uniref:PAS domain S-box protein n=1 Tax=Dawidia soli TaxID=2782352 RepID=A0AAP2D4F9_9BACT|nr:PAS domain S-box protein [Dawidia soli]MBT1685156.1 PAS domain S-box protein [Dawidia soli]
MINGKKASLQPFPADHRNVDSLWHALQTTLTGKTGQAFFDTAVTSLNVLLDADITFIGTFSASQTTVSTLAVCDRSGMLENIQYPLAGGPCDEVRKSGAMVFYDGIAARHPHIPFLRARAIDGYVGIPICDLDRSPVGIIVSLFKRPVLDSERVRLTFEFLSLRIGSELERIALEQRLRDQQVQGESRLREAFKRELALSHQLKQREEWYLFALQVGNLAVYDWYPQEDKTVFNTKLYELIGHDAGEFNPTFTQWLSLVHPEEQACFAERKHAYAPMASQPAIQIYRLQDRAGTYRWIEDQHMPIEWDAEGRVTRIIGIIKDIDAEKRSADALSKLNKDLRESEDRWAYALEGNGDGVYEWRISTRQFYFSPRAKEIMGIDLGPEQDFSRFIRHVHPDLRSEFRANFETSLRPPYHPFTMEVQVLDDARDYRWIMFRAKVVEVDDDNNPQRMVGTVTDLSDHKVIQKELTIYEEMIKQNHSAILFTSMDGTIEFLNDTAVELLGYKQHEIIEKDIATLLPEPSAEHLLQEHCRSQQEFITQSGRRLLTQVVTSLIRQDGDPMGFVINILDITERKRLEDEVTALTMTKLEIELEMQRKLTEMIILVQENEKESIARELHDGVGQLLSLVKLQLEGLHDVLTPEQQRQCRSVQELLLHVTTDIKSLTSDLMPLSIRNLGLESAITALLERYQVFRGKQVTIQCKINLDGFEPEQAPAMHIYRIAQEGVNNAMKYAQATSLSVMVMKLKNSLHLLIEDNGKGFDVDEALSRQNSFGLKTMVERARLLHGKLLVNSASRAGTTISLTIPLNADVS